MHRHYYESIYHTEYYFLDNDVIIIRDSYTGEDADTHPTTLNYYQAITDNLGSIIAVYDNNLNKVYEASYDAWGRQTVTLDEIGLYRGYTGHENVGRSELVNMNHRVYDSSIGRFLSPDNYVQLPENSQSFNRYSYCINNPLKYTDPSGELFGIDDAIVAFAIGGFNVAMATYNGESVWKAVGISLLSSAASYGMGAAFNGIGGLFGHSVGGFGNELLRAGAHGLASGVCSALQGNNFGAGFASGALASMAGSGAQWLGLGEYGVLGATTMFGGIGSAAFGGNFIDGAITGLNIGLYNHTWKEGSVTYNNDNPNNLYGVIDDVVVIGKKTQMFRAAKFIGEFSLAVGAYDYVSKNTGIDSKGRFRYRQANGKLSPNAIHRKVFKGAPKLGFGMSVASQIPDVMGAYKEYGLNDIRFLRTATVATGSIVGGYVGSVWGTQLGASAGGFLGTPVPMVGNAAGAVAGGMAGGVAGGYYGSEFGGNLAGRIFDVIF